MEQKVVLTFDNYSQKFVLDALGIKKEGNHLIDREGNKLKSSLSEEEIKAREFGGVLQGSKIFIKNDSTELVEFFLSRLEKQQIAI